MMSFLLLSVSNANAQGTGITNPALTPSVGSGPGGPIIGRIISAIVGVFLVAGVILALLHLLFGGISWITAAGDKTKLQNAQERITQAIVGLIILAAIWALMMLVGVFTGLGFPTFNLPNLGP